MSGLQDIWFVIFGCLTARNKPPALNIPSRAPAQLTIFYAGSVSVFDAVTAEKVGSLLTSITFKT